MNRTWLLRLAPIVIALLHLAVPRTASAAELGQCREPTRAAPRAVLVAKVVLARAEARADTRLSQADPFTGSAPLHVALHGVVIDRQTVAATQLHHTSSPSRLPRSRAPPPQS